MTNFINLVVAASTNRGIGKNGALPWRIRGDMAFFKKITTSTSDESKINAVIMGRKTWDSIPLKFKPLAKRVNIVLSKTLPFAPEGTLLATSLDDALDILQKPPCSEQIENIFIIGGSSVYEAALNHPACHRIYLTNVLKDFDCDTFLPKFDMGEYKVVSDDRVPVGIQRDNDINYEFQVLEKTT